MKIDFIPLANVPTVESLTDSAKVLVIDSGEVKKTAKSNIGGGGGGSSDFSTAEVTITNLTNDGVVVFPCIGADYGDGMETWDTMGIMIAEPDPDGMTYSIPVFKDGSILVINGNPPYTIAVTGDITEDSGSVTVSGNGTISVS